MLRSLWSKGKKKKVSIGDSVVTRDGLIGSVEGVDGDTLVILDHTGEIIERHHVRSVRSLEGEPSLTPRQLQIIEHSLGDRTHYRNRYAANPASDVMEDLDALVEKGLMARSGRGAELVWFHATEAGMALAFTAL